MALLDQVILVDKHDHVLGAMDKVQAHKGRGVLHRAISTFLFNSKGELLIQRRSPDKITCKLLWANTCCGNVRPGENRRQCARRRLHEELGITQVRLHSVGMFTYQAFCNDDFSEHEVDGVYVGHYDGKVIPSPAEVAEFAWVSWERFVTDVMSTNGGERQYVPWTRLIFEQPSILAAIDAFQKQLRESRE